MVAPLLASFKAFCIELIVPWRKAQAVGWTRFGQSVIACNREQGEGLASIQANFVFFNAYAFWMTALEALASMVLGADPFSPPLKAVFALLFAFAYYHIFIVLQQRPYMLGGLVLLMVDTVLSIVGCVVNAPMLLLVAIYGVEALLTLLILKAGVQLYWKAGDTLLL